METVKRIIKKFDGYGRTDFWMVDERNQISSMDIETKQGKFNISSAEGRMMSFIEEKILNYVIFKFITTNNCNPDKWLELTVNEVCIRGLGYQPGYVNKDDYKRVFKALDLIKGMKIRYEYDNYDVTKGKPTTYGIISSATLDPDTGKVLVKLDSIFAEQIKVKEKYYLINIDEVKSFETSKGAKLYLFLLEVLNESNSYKEYVRDVAKKMTWQNWNTEKPGKLKDMLIEKLEEVNRYGSIIVSMEWYADTKVVEFKKIGNKNGRALLLSDQILIDVYAAMPPIIKNHKDALQILIDNRHIPEAQNLDVKDYYLSQIEVAKGANTPKGMWPLFVQAIKNDYGANIRAIWASEGQDQDMKKKFTLEFNRKELEEQNRLLVEMKEKYSGMNNDEKIRIDHKAKQLMDNIPLFKEYHEGDMFYESALNDCRVTVLKEELIIS